MRSTTIPLFMEIFAVSIAVLALGCGNSQKQAEQKRREEYKEALETLESELVVLERIEDELASLTAKCDKSVADAKELVENSRSIFSLRSQSRRMFTQQKIQDLLNAGVPPEEAKRKVLADSKADIDDAAVMVREAQKELVDAMSARNTELAPIQQALEEQRDIVAKAKARRDALVTE